MTKQTASLVNSKSNTRNWLNGLLLLSLTLLLTGCATSVPEPIIITRVELISPPPLPQSLTRPIQIPRLPSRQLTHDDLLQLIADYHLRLTRANSDRLQIQDLWPDDRDRQD